MNQYITGTVIKNLREKLGHNMAKTVSLQAQVLGLTFNETIKLIEDVWEEVQDAQ